ncbi:MAG TPA: ferric reductase-like transmembrane domain-containing protein [Anaerolineales bacterium]|nr:ferric reductase-like transmembrane domain-containing protein [Anaerolineales bacterium]
MFLSKLRQNWLLIACHCVGLLPLAGLLPAWRAIDPVKALTQHTGEWGLNLLVASLAITPLYWLSGWKALPKLRKWLGLYGFFWVCGHLLVYIGLAQAWDWQAMVWVALKKQPYIQVGVLAFVLLLPLALTSSDGWKARLRKDWKRLHQLVYAIIPLSDLHYYWAKSSKLNTSRPMLFAVIILALLLIRLPAVRVRAAKIGNQIQNWRRSRKNK